MPNNIPQSYLKCSNRNLLFNGKPVVKLAELGPEGVYECLCKEMQKSIATIENRGKRTSFEMKEKIGDVTYSTCSTCRKYSQKKVLSPIDSEIPAKDKLSRQLQVI